MAVLAEIRRQNMIGRLCARTDTPTFGVAAHAFRRRTLKHRADVARLTIRAQMCTVEPESSRKMIEARTER